MHTPLLFGERVKNIFECLFAVLLSLHRPRLQPAEALAAHRVLEAMAIPLRLGGLAEGALILAAEVRPEVRPEV